MSNSESLLVSFTYGVSLKRWKKLGLKDRELEVYRELETSFEKISFLTYGNQDDEALNENDQLTFHPVYAKLSRPGNKYLRFFQSFLIPFTFPDLFSSHSIYKTNQMFGSWVPLIASKLNDRPLVVRCGYELLRNALRKFRETPTPFKLVRIIFYFFLEYFAYKSADKIFISSETDKKFIEDVYRLEADKIKKLPNFIDTEKFRPENGELKYDNRILTVSRLHPRKNLENLIRALGGTEIGLDVIGKGNRKSFLENLSREMNVDVNFRGTFRNDAIPEEINKYPVFILPSKFENNPKAILEAMACGGIVIGTDVPGIREIITSGENGFLCEPDPDSLKETITSVFENHREMNDIRKNARETIVAGYSLSAIVEQEKNEYEDLLR